MPDIIIVEDNIEIGTLLCDFIRKKNYTVSLAETGEKALDIFERYGANLIVLDIGLQEWMAFLSVPKYGRLPIPIFSLQVPGQIRKAH